MRKTIGAVLLVMTLASCAIDNDPGWTSGPNAKPFDAAARECQDRTESSRGAAFEECMASLGWSPAKH